MSDIDHAAAAARANGRGEEGLGRRLHRCGPATWTSSRDDVGLRTLDVAELGLRIDLPIACERLDVRLTPEAFAELRSVTLAGRRALARAPAPPANQ